MNALCYQIGSLLQSRSEKTFAIRSMNSFSLSNRPLSTSVGFSNQSYCYHISIQFKQIHKLMNSLLYTFHCNQIQSNSEGFVRNFCDQIQKALSYPAGSLVPPYQNHNSHVQIQGSFTFLWRGSLSFEGAHGHSLFFRSQSQVSFEVVTFTVSFLSSLFRGWDSRIQIQIDAVSFKFLEVKPERIESRKVNVVYFIREVKFRNVVYT